MTKESEESEEISSASSLKLLPVKKGSGKSPKEKKPPKEDKKNAKQFDKNISYIVAGFLDDDSSINRPAYGDKVAFEEFVKIVHGATQVTLLRAALMQNNIGNNAGKTQKNEIKALMNFKIQDIDIDG